MTVDAVVKVGGGLLARGGRLDAVLAAIDAGRGQRSWLIVPGGGPFADAVRDVDRRVSLTDEAAHWMAILAMDQYAHVIASRLPGSTLVTSPAEIELARAARLIPVLAPYRWLREADPLPWSWEVTSDSIAAWVAGEVGAEHLVLVKPVAQGDRDLVDPYFARALPARVRVRIVSADEVGALSEV